MRTATRLLTILKSGNLRYPISVDFSALADGPLPSRFTGSTWAVASGKAVNTPTETSLLTDGGLENWTTANNLTSWNEIQNGTSTVNREETDVHGGTYANRSDIDASNNEASIWQTVALAAGDWSRMGVWAKSSVAGKQLQMVYNAGGAGFAPVATLTTGYAQYRAIVRASANNPSMTIKRSGTASGTSLYMDDVEVIKLTRLSLFATVEASAAGIVRAAWTIAAYAQAGVVMNLDDPANPQNYVMAYVNRGNQHTYLEKCVNGTTTTLVDGTPAYVAGANIEIRKSGTTYKLYYNGSQVGTDQTVSDASITASTRSGIFSTDGGNSLDSFFAGLS